MSGPSQVVDKIIDRETGELLDLSPGALCRQCSEIGYTCCQPEYGVTVTLHDAKRMHRATEEPYDQFLTLNVIEDAELVEGLKTDPHFKKLFFGKRRLLQHIQHDLDCHFLGETGCTAFEDRPRLCHFHPFWFKFVKRKKGGDEVAVFFDAVDDREEADEADCLVVTKTWPNLALGLQSIGENLTDLEFQARQMKEEIAYQERVVKDLLVEVKAKDVTIEMLVPLIEAAPEFEV